MKKDWYDQSQLSPIHTCMYIPFQRSLYIYNVTDYSCSTTGIFCKFSVFIKVARYFALNYLFKMLFTDGFG